MGYGWGTGEGYGFLMNGAVVLMGGTIGTGVEIGSTRCGIMSESSGTTFVGCSSSWICGGGVTGGLTGGLGIVLMGGCVTGFFGGRTFAMFRNVGKPCSSKPPV